MLWIRCSERLSRRLTFQRQQRGLVRKLLFFISGANEPRIDGKILFTPSVVVIGVEIIFWTLYASDGSYMKRILELLVQYMCVHWPATFPTGARMTSYGWPISGQPVVTDHLIFVAFRHTCFNYNYAYHGHRTANSDCTRVPKSCTT